MNSTYLGYFMQIQSAEQLTSTKYLRRDKKYSRQIKNSKNRTTIEWN